MGMLSFSIWAKVGEWKIKQRREDEKREEEIAAALRRIHGRDGDSGVTASTVVAATDCDGDQEVIATLPKATPLVGTIRTTYSTYEKVNTEESSNIV